MSSRRHPTHPPQDRSGPKPPVHFSPNPTIPESAVVTGTYLVTIGPETVLHHLVRLESLEGGIVIGRRCVIEERSKLGVREGAAASKQSSSDGGGGDNGVTLGDYVMIRVGAVVEAGCTKIGDGTTIGEGARVGAGAKIGKNCVILPREVISAGDHVPDNTVVYSNGLRRHSRRDMETAKRAQACEIQLLQRLIPSKPEKFTPAPS